MIEEDGLASEIVGGTMVSELYQGVVISVDLVNRTATVRPDGATTSLFDMSGVRWITSSEPSANTTVWYFKMGKRDRLIVGMIDLPGVRFGGAWKPGDTKWTFSTTLDPTFVWAEGTTYNRADLPDLFNALGGAASPHGLPSGTTFNVPNTKRRVMAGLDTGDGQFNFVGLTGGTAAETAPLPVHNHGNTGGTTANHSHTWGASTFVTAAGANAATLDNPTGNGTGSKTGTTNGHNQDHAHSTGNAGTGGTHNNLQPYIVARCEIKT